MKITYLNHWSILSLGDSYYCLMTFNFYADSQISTEMLKSRRIFLFIEKRDFGS